MRLKDSCWKKMITTPLFFAILISFTALPAGATSSGSFQSNFKLASVDSAAEQEFLSRTNALRASRGLGALKSNSELLAKARAWSQTQASSGSIFHSTLTNGVTQNWHRLGENVGMGPDVLAIHNALVASPRHFDNLVDSGFTDVGIGVVRQGNIIYVTQVFMQLMPQSTTTQAPAATNQNNSSGQASAIPAKTQSSSSSATEDQLAKAVPLKTASADLTAIIQRISVLES